MIIKGAKHSLAAPAKKVEESAVAPKKRVEPIEPVVVIGPIVTEEIKEEPVVPVRKKVKKIIEEIEQEVTEQE